MGLDKINLICVRCINDKNALFKTWQLVVVATSEPTELYRFFVAMSNKCKLCGVHGTTEPCKLLIKQEGFLPGRDGQLGSGCYFFFCSPDGKEAALNWASSTRGRRQAPLYGLPTTISAQIELEENEIIDLSSQEIWEKIYNFAQRLHNLFPDDPRTANNTMKGFLHDLALEKARLRSVNYASSVIITWYPPFDGHWKKQRKCFVVKGNKHRIVPCDGIDDD